MITETLGQKHRRFARMVAKLINKACEMGAIYNMEVVCT